MRGSTCSVTGIPDETRFTGAEAVSLTVLR